MKEELRKYIKENLEVERSSVFFGASFAKAKCAAPVYEDYIASEKECFEAESLPEFLEQNKEYSNFQKTLFDMIDERNLVDADVYNKVHLDRRLFSKIRNDKEYHPSKETVLLLGLSLELNESEIEELLHSASYSLPRNNNYDLILRFCFMKGIYNILDVNDLLSEYDCNLFNY